MIDIVLIEYQGEKEDSRKTQICSNTVPWIPGRLDPWHDHGHQPGQAADGGRCPSDVQFVAFYPEDETEAHHSLNLQTYARSAKTNTD